MQHGYQPERDKIVLADGLHHVRVVALGEGAVGRHQRVYHHAHAVETKHGGAVKILRSQF